MKKIILAAFAALAANAAMAVDSTGAENTFYISPDPVTIDKTTHMGTVNVWLDNETDNFNTFLLDIYLPEGFTIETKKNGAYKVTVNDDSKVTDHQITVTNRDGFYRFLGLSLSSTPIETGDDLLFSFNIIAPDSFIGEAQIDIENIQIASGSTVSDVKKHTMDNLSFAVTTNSTTTGLDDLAVDEYGDGLTDDDTVYDLQGRIVKGRPAAGIYIINGQKRAIK